MSEMEHNKGRLIPTGIDIDDYDPDSLEELLEDHGFVLVDGEVYSVEWEIKQGELYGFQRAFENMDGTIDFETYHYNGGGHWSECVERALNDH